MKKTLSITLIIMLNACSTTNISLDGNNTNTQTLSVKKNEEDKKGYFTLQEYVDKVAVYLKEKNTTAEDSHVKGINSLPVIGK